MATVPSPSASRSISQEAIAPDVLQAALLRAFDRKSYVTGEIRMPCVPALLDVYITQIKAVFEAIAKPFSDPEMDSLQRILAEKLQQGSLASQPVEVVLSYQPATPPQKGVVCQMSLAGYAPHTRTYPNTPSAPAGAIAPQDMHHLFWAKGELQVPCLPAFCDRFVSRIEDLFRALTSPFSPLHIANFRQMVRQNLEHGFQQASSAFLAVQYESANPPQQGLIMKVFALNSPITKRYKSWAEQRNEDMFGKQPDAKLMDVLQPLPHPARILDVGAGNGRNSLPLAKLGHHVDAIELTPEFANLLRTSAADKGVSLQVTEGNMLDATVRVRPGFYHLALVSEVTSHFRDTTQLRSLFAKLCDALCPSGLLLTNVFVAADNYQPDSAAREISQMAWSTFFTRNELAEVLERLPLRLLSDESMFAYEKEHLPPEAWPPTQWFPGWSTGRDVFLMANPAPPVEMRWLLFQRW